MEAKPGDQPTRVVSEKAVEQGQTYTAATKSDVDAKVKEVVDSCNRATKRVPDEYLRALKVKGRQAQDGGDRQGPVMADSWYT